MFYRYDLPLLWNLFRFSSFSVTMTTSVNKLLRLESVTSAVPRITWWNSPGLLPPFLHTASDQNWKCRRPGNEARFDPRNDLVLWRHKDWHGLHESSYCYFKEYVGTRNLKAVGSQILAFQCDKLIWPVSWSSMHAMIKESVGGSLENVWIFS